MDLTGKLSGISRDYMTRKPMISFVIDADPNGIEDLADKELIIKVTKRTKPRSLDSNAYFHVLCDKLRQKLGISMASCKNHLITWYGQIEYIEDSPLVYKTNAPFEYIQELEEAHLKFLKRGDDGAYWYRVYRGSHTYNSIEMAQLIEGTIAECKEQGIETASPDELKRMAELWQKRKL